MSMEEKQNSQTFQDFSSSVIKPDNEQTIADIIKHCYKKNIPIEIFGSSSKKKNWKKLSISKNFRPL